MKYWLVAIALLISLFILPIQQSSADKEKDKSKQNFLIVFDYVWKKAVDKKLASGQKKPAVRFLSSIDHAICGSYANAFVGRDGSINICVSTFVDLFAVEIEEGIEWRHKYERYFIAHEISHVLKKHSFYAEEPITSENEEENVFYECEADLGAAELLGKKMTATLLKKQLKKGLDSIHQKASQRALDVLEGRRGVCNTD